ncbi:Site-specific recombinase XerD [Burkholderia sp. YR290]|nr:Site-specific recombinase XerD [Burkholderia sp. YR290]
MHLVKATDDFRLAGRPMAGFPIVLWEDLTSCLEVNEFLRFYLSRGAIGSQRSWEAIGRSLYDYFGFLEAHNLHWKDVSQGSREDLVAAYRRYSSEVHQLRRNTLRLRLTYICEFYDYALNRGWVNKLPYRLERRSAARSTGFLAHIDASGGKVAVRSVMPRKHRSLIKFLRLDQVKQLRDAATNPHHQIIIRLALGSGLRREELATFPKAYVFDPYKAGKATPTVAVTLDPQDGTGMRTKGSKPRVIYIKRELMLAMYRYAEIFRGERAAHSATGEPATLFLTERGVPWADSGKGIEAMVRKLGERAGIDTHPHMLRHTYATHTLVKLQGAKGDRRVEPLVFLQRQLGHASIQTTMAYLHVVNELADEAVLAYDAELDDWPEPHE